MDLSYSHASGQRILRQRNLLAISAVGFAALSALLATIGLGRDREVILQPILRSPLTLSSAGASRDYLELVTRDTVALTLNRSPQNLDYWMNAVLDITAPRAHGKIKADLLKILEEQRGSSISQFFTTESMKIDVDRLRSEVSGQLHTIVGNEVISNDVRTFRYDWENDGLSLKLVRFGLAEDGKEKKK